MADRTVLHVIDALNVGGAQELVALLAKWTPAPWRMAVCVLQPCLEMRERIEAAGVPVFALNRERPSITSPWRFLRYALCSILDIARLKKDLGAEVLHCHLSDAEFLGILAAKLCGARVVITFHTPALAPERPKSDPRTLLRMLAMRCVYRLADAVVAVSGETKAALRDRIGLPESKLRTILNGVDCQALAKDAPPEALRSSLGLSETDAVLLNVGRLVPLKGQAIILDALAMLLPTHPTLRLCIAGEGPAREALTDRIAALSLVGRAMLLGNRSDAPDLLALADLFIMASIYEGTSLALMEAMAAGKPIVATDVGGNRELLEGGKNALLVPPGDAKALAQAVAALLDDPAQGRRLGHAARDKACLLFDIRRVAAAHAELWS